MHRGSLPRSIAVPAGPIEPNHAPDGLTETAIDALIAEVNAEVKPVRPRPGWLSSDPTEHRRERHRAHQITRLLASTWLTGERVDAPENGEAA